VSVTKTYFPIIHHRSRLLRVANNDLDSLPLIQGTTLRVTLLASRLFPILISGTSSVLSQPSTTQKQLHPSIACNYIVFELAYPLFESRTPDRHVANDTPRNRTTTSAYSAHQALRKPGFSRADRSQLLSLTVPIAFYARCLLGSPLGSSIASRKAGLRTGDVHRAIAQGARQRREWQSPSSHSRLLS